MTGGTSDKVAEAVPFVGKTLDKIGETVGRGAFKVTVKMATAAGVALVLVCIAVFGGFSGVLAAVTGQRAANPPKPTAEQCDAMPEGWCDVVYEAQKSTHGRKNVVPWTVLAGLARVATDYGRTSPYDMVDRFPDRPIPPYLAAHYATTEVAGSAKLGSVSSDSGSLAWGGHKNGQIPASALCPVSFAPSHLLECNAAAALEQLNALYMQEHNGQSLGVADGYRDLAGQVYQRNRWCAKGQCTNAALPGTSNHGWALAADMSGFGSLGVYTDPDYLWMKDNASAFGWYHPESMEPGGRGPQEPWHWEYHPNEGSGALASAYVPGDGLRGDGVVLGSSAAGSCEVDTPSTPIGGVGRQAAGPFLLLPAAAQELIAEGGDPQNPCDAAKFVAERLSDAADDVVSERGKPKREDHADGSAFWQMALTMSHAIGDPDNTTGECTVLDPNTPVDQMIEQIWACELAQVPNIYVVSGVTTSDSGVKFSQYSQATGVAQLISEAKSVAWAFSQYGAAICSESAEVTGVFPLTAQAATDAQEPARCDVQANIRAAARTVIAGESVRPQDRSSSAGPFAPMLGGWASLPAALGPDAALFPAAGPKVQFSPTAQCSAAVDDVVVAAAGQGSVFAQLGPATSLPADTSPYSAALGSWPDTVTDACVGATNADLAAEAVKAVQAHTPDQVGVGMARSGDTAEPPPPPPSAEVTVDEWVGGVPDDVTAPEPDPSDAPSEAPQTEVPQAAVSPAVLGVLAGGRGYSVHAAPQELDPAALAGLALWFSTQAQDTPAAQPAVFGQQSVITRLSTTGNYAPVASPSGSLTFSVAPWQQRVGEWAIFYGGTVQRFDTFGTRTGTLEATLTGAALQFAPTSGDVATQVATVMDAAKRHLGVPYAWGGGGKNGPSAGTTGIVGFDCSGLMEYAYAQAGYDIGGWTGLQQNQGTPVASLSEAQPGDLLFFGSPIHHVAMYLGDNQLIHASKPGDVVKIVRVYETPTLIKRVLVPRTAGSGGDGLDAWISTALTVLYQNGLPQGVDDVAALKLIIDKESSGNPAAVNTWDSNARAGHPSFGLMQTIPSTFDAHALPGYTDKADPVAQIIAGTRYAQARYGGLDNVPGVKAVRAGQPYRGY